MFPQSTILDPLFWMAFGALQVLVFASANRWANQYQLEMNWWKWTIAGGWWFSLLLSIAGGFTLLGENEGAAGWYFLGFSGTGLIIGGAIILRVFIMLKPKSV